MQTKAGYAAIIGKPNAGKSTLMNVVLGTKLSIVTPKPQTTRKNVLGIYSGDTLQVIFIDTPGLLQPKYELQRSMVKSVMRAIDDAELLVVLLDVSKYKSDYFTSSFYKKIKNAGKPTILLINKIDLLKNKKELLPIIDEMKDMGVFNEIIPVSALKNKNIDEFISTIEKYISESPFLYDPEEISTQPERFFVTEIIREQVFSLYEQEIPYSTEVNIAEFKERSSGKWYISAEIIVERASQKGIIIGDKGKKIKEVGVKARLEIEKFLDKPIYLELFVKVREKWRSNKTLLRSYGY